MTLIAHIGNEDQASVRNEIKEFFDISKGRKRGSELLDICVVPQVSVIHRRGE